MNIARYKIKQAGETKIIDVENHPVTLQGHNNVMIADNVGYDNVTKVEYLGRFSKCQQLSMDDYMKKEAS